MQTSIRRTPGVYLTELDAFPPSVVGVQTAIPAFIGYTEKANKNGQPLLKKPTLINSTDDFELYFGQGPDYKFTLAQVTTGPGDFSIGTTKYSLTWTGATKFGLYNAIRLFYSNGGGPCYIVSVGDYSAAVAAGPLEAGMEAISHETGPTMLLSPDAMFLATGAYSTLISKMLAQANNKQDRVALLDVLGGGDPDTANITSHIDQFRGEVGANFLNYGIAYFPWLHTSIVQPDEIDFTNIDDTTVLITALKAEAVLLYSEPRLAAVNTLIDTLGTATTPDLILTASQDVGAAVPLLFSIYTIMRRKLNLLPAAAAMAGIYTMVDSTRGVWKAPANVSLTSVTSPAVYIDDNAQAEMNVPLHGKAVNALRAFPGQGVMVWGGRTLDGNSRDYRYINVRRTLIYIEQSLKLAASSFLFEPNNANTWVSVKGMIDNFLMSVWQSGGLMGDKASDAYQVTVGLGQTMTGMDILDGYMRIQVLLQLLRPAEFIEITFQQKMQGV